MNFSRERAGRAGEGARRFVGGRAWQIAVGALAAGLALAGSGAPHALALGLVGGAAAAALVAAAGLRTPVTGLVVAAALVGGLVVGRERVAAIDRPGLALRAGDELAGRATLLGVPRASRFGWSAELELSDGGARVLGRGESDLPPPPVRIGEEVRLAGRLEPPSSQGDFDWAAHLRRRGVLRELELYAIEPTGRRRGGLAGFVDGLRGRAERALDAALPADRAALVRGMVLGQDERIDTLVRDDFRDSGLAHLLAVSGQNVMLLAALALPMVGLAGGGPRLRTAVLLGLIAVYVPLAGAGPSLQRAGIMGAAGLIAVAAARPALGSYALALAAAVTLALNPRAAGDPGWQLSFAAVAGILWLAPVLRPLARPLPRVLAEGAAITVAATLATAPLVAFHFDRVPIAGLAANLLALPVVPLVMWAGMLVCALAQVPAGLAGRAAAAVGWAAGPAVDALSWLARTFAELPGGAVALPLRSPAALVAAYVLPVAAIAVARLRGRPAAAAAGRDLGGALRRMPARRRAGLAAGLAALAALGIGLTLRPAAWPERLTVRFLDVGQGDATLIQHPDGTAVLFDGGPPEARTVRLLRAAGVRRLALVVATHASRDHHGGLLEVVERLPVATLVDGGDGTPDRSFRALLAVARERGARIVRAAAPLELRAGGLTVRVVSPPPRAPGPAPEDPNPRAIVAVVSAGSFELLLSADAESDTLSDLPLPDVDAMKVPHHGSADPGLGEALRRLRPEIAAIEVGENDYGHPAPSTLAALADAGVATWRTDRHGSVTLTVERDGLHVEGER